MFYKENDILELTICSICLQEYNEPKILPCGYTFCQECIQELIENGNEIECPSCKKAHPVPPEGEFPTNLLTAQLVKKRAKPTYRGENAEKLRQLLDQVASSFQDLQAEQSRNPLDQIQDHSSTLKRQFDLAVETTIFEAQSYRNEMFKRINDYEKECIKRVELNKSTPVIDPTEAQLFLHNWSSYLNEFKLDDELLKDGITNAQSLLEKIREEKETQLKAIFGENQMTFWKDSNLIKNKNFGELVMCKTKCQEESRSACQKLKIFQILNENNLNCLAQKISIQLLDNNQLVVAFLNDQNRLNLLLLEYSGKVLALNKTPLSYLVSSFKICASNDLIYVHSNPIGWNSNKAQVNAFSLGLEVQNPQPLTTELLTKAIFADQEAFYFISTAPLLVTYDKMLSSMLRSLNLYSSLGSEASLLQFQINAGVLFMHSKQASKIFKIQLSNNELLPTLTLGGEHEWCSYVSTNEGYFVLGKSPSSSCREIGFYDQDIRLVKPYAKTNTETTVQKIFLTPQNQIVFFDEINCIMYFN